jgi:hypothetical protein
MMERRGAILVAILLFVIAIIYDMGLQSLMRPYAIRGMYFHPWSSEDMMQTVSLRDLRSDPVRTILYTHIEPPVPDLLRAALAQFWPSLGDEQALRRVDYSLYVIWAVILGLLVVLVFLWLSRQCGLTMAILGALLFLLHPASIFFATFLDATLLSAFLVLWLYYLLWKMKNGRPVSMILFSFVFVLLFLTRSIFQWPSIILLAVCLLLIGAARRQVITFLVLAGLICGIYVAKQLYLFGITWTSSFAGVNLSNSIGVGMGTAKYAQYLDDPSHPSMADANLPDVLTSKTKTAGQRNFNNIDYLYLNQLLLGRYERELLKAPPQELAESYLENAMIYFRPSSTYSSGHVIVERLPWRSLYDAVFSAPTLPILLLLGVGVWVAQVVKTRGFAHGLGMALLGLFVLVVSIVSDRGENMRFKFFLEPVMIVFLISQSASVIRAFQRTRRPGERAA